MRITIGIIGMICSYIMIRHRQALGDMMGEADWMRKIGGVYMVMVFLGVLVFFWSVAYMVNTLDIFFYPLLYLIPLPQSVAPK